MTTYVDKDRYRMFIAAFFIIEANWEQAKCPSTGEGINKLGHIHTME